MNKETRSEILGIVFQKLRDVLYCNHICGMTQRKCVYQIVSNVYRFGVLFELNLNKVHRRSVLADVGMYENAEIQ